MGNRNTKSSLKNAIIYLNISADRISSKDEKFWNQIFLEDSSLAEEVIKGISIQEIRMLRDGSPRNFALLAYKMVECLHLSTGTLCNTQSQQTAVLNATRILTRLIPCVFEDLAWHYFFEMNAINAPDKIGDGEPDIHFPKKSDDEKNFISYLPNAQVLRAISGQLKSSSERPSQLSKNENTTRSRDLLLSNETLVEDSIDEVKFNGATRGPSSTSNISGSGPTNHDQPSLMQTIIISICDLLFCPEFTVVPHGNSYLSNTVDGPPEDLKSLSTYDYVWEPGIGFASNINSTTHHDKNRSELLRVLLISLSSTLYIKPEKSNLYRNRWIEIFVSKKNRHTLPLFTSLMNVIFVHKSVRSILQFTNTSSTGKNRETLIGYAMHILLAALDYRIDDLDDKDDPPQENTFIEYMSRIHRAEDLDFIIQGFVRLLNHNLTHKYSWTSNQQIELDLELMLLLWKICNYNRKFMIHLLNSNESLDIMVPMLYHLNKNFQDPSRTALIHLGVFNLLILSGERNFGVKLNKTYTASSLGDLPEFNGSHADLMIIVFHKLIMYGYKINQLYDYLLNILVNISPYLKGLTILTSKCLIQLFETFSSAYVIFTEPNYHQLVIFLLEIFNNLIQYQFDGNANLIYTILSKKELFINLAKLPTAQASIDKVLRKLAKRKMRARQLELMNLQQQEGHLKKTESTANLEQSARDSANECFFNFELATVSCATCQQHDSSPSRQEVSLVATPDIHHFTHPTHPFLLENEANANDYDLDRIDQDNREATKSSFNLDDILDQSCNYDVNEFNFKHKTNTYDDSISESSLLVEPKDVNEFKTDKKMCENVGSCNSKMEECKNANGVGKKWRPTSEWLIEWKRSLPLDTVIRMINVLVPQVDQFKRSEGRLDDDAIIKFLQNGTLVGLLPVPHPILIRKYRTNKDSIIWFRACTWAIIYVKSTAWINSDILLIRIL